MLPPVAYEQRLPERAATQTAEPGEAAETGLSDASQPRNRLRWHQGAGE